MRLLLKQLYHNTLDATTAQWADLVCETAWHRDFNSLPEQKKLQIFNNINKNFTAYLDDEFRKLKARDEVFLTRWGMLRKSDFNEKLWSQFSDIAEMSKALLVQYLNKIIPSTKSSIPKGS